MAFVVLIGRILFSAVFIISGFTHFNNDTIQFAAQQGVLYSSYLVPLSGVLEILGGLSILLGYKARFGAWLLVLFLIPVTGMMHRFWEVADPQESMMQQIMFLKNLSMLGGAFIISYFGSGPLSIKE